SKMLTEKKLPGFKSSEQVDLLFFIILLDLRNPVRINQSVRGIELIKERFLAKNSKNKNSGILTAFDKFDAHQENVKRVISHAERIVCYCMDLGYKLLKNTTEIPFITSDYPLIKYNQFLE